jgi:hypothetical protein
MAAAQRWEKEIRERWENQVPLTGKDEHFIRCLITERYPADWLSSKLKGQGIKQIHVDAAPGRFQNENRCFWITRTDGTVFDISVAKQCFRKDSPLDDFRAACRTAVRPWIKSYLHEYFAAHGDPSGNVVCQLSGAVVSRGWAVVHHHEPSFHEIVGGFVGATGVNVSQVASALLGYEDGESEKRFRDSQLAEEFEQYHARHAKVIMIVDRKTHSRLPRPGLAPKSELAQPVGNS